MDLINNAANKIPAHSDELKKMAKDLSAIREPMRRNVMGVLSTAIDVDHKNDALFWLKDFYKDLQQENAALYNTHLYNETPKNVLHSTHVKPIYNDDAPLLNGYEILNRYFDRTV